MDPAWRHYMIILLCLESGCTATHKCRAAYAIAQLFLHSGDICGQIADAEQGPAGG